MHRGESISELTRRNVELIARIEKASEARRTFGEWLADQVAAWTGSWIFLSVQAVALAAWMTLNVLGWWYRWDPYPFILLNLVLSFQAAFAMPIILMSQNRQSRITEERHRLDLQINVLAEQETTEQLRLLRLLCGKFDIPVNDHDERAYEESTRPDEILQQIKENVPDKEQSQQNSRTSVG